ncbi:acyltransferase family protein [Pseudomonas sp. JDS08PS003]|uniref:acyltransferase family protein n=1 Tax=Pseudomonas sp. JDS08PS003 TaxID=2497162 RepID=UPI00385795DA
MIRLFAKASSILLIALLAIYVARPTASVDLNNIKHQDRNAYIAAVPFWITIFSAPENQKSIFKDGILFENGRPIGRGGALHDDISENGGGKWSYWGRDIYLSQTKHNSSTTPSEMAYRLSVSFDPPLYIILPTATLLILFILLHTTIRTRELSTDHLKRAAPCKSWKIKALKYSPEIDGIRAIAVGLVLLYHFDFPHLKGGFVGVDVFFVISGYLITSIICQDLHSEKFSFRKFYFRRARRIFPALIAVSLLTILCATAITPPENYKEFGGSLLSSSLFISNIYFYFQSGYFDSDAISKPLLHTWSLGVEEQFYIFFPLLLFFTGRLLNQSKAIISIIAFALISLISAEIALSFSRNAAFFLSPFRFFEFTFGAILVFINKDYLNQKNKEVVAAIGTLLILAPSFLYSSQMSFPGIATLPICIGAALLIYCNDAPITSKILSSGAFVAIGKISYSAYLVHWPIVVFYKSIRVSQAPLSLLEIAALLSATLIIAKLLYQYVETPFRHIEYLKQHGRIKAGLISFCALLAPLAIIGGLIYSSSGLPQRFSDATQQLLKTPIEQHRAYVWNRFNKLEGKKFSNNHRKRVLIIGDSQAADFLNIIEETTPEKLDISTILIPVSCQAVIPINTEFYDNIPTDTMQKKECRERQNNILNDIRISSADIIVIASSWTDYGIDQIQNTIHALTTSNRNAKLIIIPSKAQGKGGIDVMLLSRWKDVIPEKIAFASRTSNLESKRAKLMDQAHGAQILDIGKYICNWNKKTCSVFSNTGDPIFSDVSHITKSGAIFIGEKLQKSGELEIFN